MGFVMEMPQSSVSRESNHRRNLKRYADRGLIYLKDEPKLQFLDIDVPEKIKNEMIGAFNWYSYNKDNKKAKQWILEYMKKIGEDKRSINRVAASRKYFPNTAGWIARILNNGTENLPNEYIKHLENTIELLKKDGKKSLKKQEKNIEALLEGKQRSEKISKLKLEKHTNETLDFLEEHYDNFLQSNKFEKINLEEHFKVQNLTVEQCKTILEYFQQYYLNELLEVKENKDNQLSEGYSNYSKKTLNLAIEYVTGIIETCKSYQKVAPKKVRRIRKKKIKPAAAQVKNLNYEKENGELKSIPPEKIIGGVQLWVYNTKYRTLGVYHASDSSGFTVKGSTIKNFDPNTSIEKKLRKPDDILSQVLSLGKPAMKKILPPIKCKEKKLTGRINNNTILLRVF